MIRRFIFKHMNRLLGGKKKNYGFFFDMYKCAIDGMNYGWGDYSVKNQSEKNIFKALDERCEEKIVMFDVGAHEGEYTLNFMDHFRDSSKEMTIHAFEPMEKSFEIYKDNVKEIKNAQFVYNRFGLSDSEGSVPIYFNNDTSIIASLYKRQLDYFDIDFDKEQSVEVTTLDGYCSKNGIERIDLLKMVVEGSEYRVLKGAERMMSEGRIGMIQFGFGGSDIDSRHFFRDYMNLFRSMNYGVYRVMKDGLIRLETYDEKYEIFQYINFLAIKE